MHGVRVPMWQTQFAGPVRTAHMSVLLTVNIVSHNPARSSSDNLNLNDAQNQNQIIPENKAMLLEQSLTRPSVDGA